ncbi:signal peptidase II [Bdellovibrio sp. SKB1291214]|uniref:signal peptidase II n=1 Tax=Bdellovibrio sp. SKB1291214 TaxID=1732569 RepID=UPI000B51ACED|nr:signal peptidase II [Bdellovibrio sp. SKB1291214]UYL09996.1 signal peptidase II [Bdellovibrio sp. SKB1291214]
MKKREWLIVIFPLLVTWLFDRVTKLWAADITAVKSYGPLHFVLHHNHGAMLGLFSDLPSVLRIVSLSTGGAFLLCTYALIQYLLPIKSLTLRTGLSILIGGILGNVADRIAWGYVVDFIVVGTPSLSSPAFNIADALQWVGYGLIVLAIIREGELLWPENNSRKKFWVNLSFQLKYCILMMAVGLSLTLISLVFSYTYLRVTITELVGSNQFLLNKFLVPYVITFTIICIAFCMITFAVGKVLSHRIAGPIYAFERYINGIFAGENARVFKVRKGDEFKELEQLAAEISKRLAVIKSERTVNVVEFSDSGSDPDTKAQNE